MDGGKTEETTVVNALSTTLVGTARPITAGASWGLSTKFKWTESEPDSQLIEELLKPSNEIIQNELKVIGVFFD